MSVGTTRGEADYTAALCSELRSLGEALPGVKLDTIFFGGGTPGLLDLGLMRSIMDEVRSAFEIASGAEITIEVNPSSTSEERACAWMAAGFNRVSIGVQGLDPGILEFLDRVHDGNRALAAVDEVRRAGFRAVNCDLIYGAPGLSDECWRSTLERVLAADPGHLSCYELTVEPGTPLHVAVTRGAVRVVDPETALRQHWIAVDVAALAGYDQYEVSNFASGGARCRHNLVYWEHGHYLAAGVGAHGHIPPDAAVALGIAVREGSQSVRYWHGRSIPGYVEAAHRCGFAFQGSECVPEAQAVGERLLLGLRLNAGVLLRHEQLAEAAQLVDAGLLLLDDRRARATRRGQEVLNAVALRLASV